jgi:hypothetical protein
MIELRPTKGGGSICALLQQLCHHLLDNDTNKKLRRCPHMKVNDYFNYHEVYEIIKSVEMDWILPLDMPLSAPKKINSCLLYALSEMLPKLREIDLSKILSGSKIQHFSIQCPHLEKVTSNDINKAPCVSLNGYDMISSKDLKKSSWTIQNSIDDLKKKISYIIDII